MDGYRHSKQTGNQIVLFITSTDCLLIHSQFSKGFLTDVSKLQRRESQLVSEVGKLLVELTVVKTELQVTKEHASAQTEKYHVAVLLSPSIVLMTFRWFVQGQRNMSLKMGNCWLQSRSLLCW